LILLGFIRFSTAHYQNYLFPMPQHKSLKTPVVTVFFNLVHLSHGTAMGQILRAPPGCSPYKPGGLVSKTANG
jgi:hypothetical protein